MKLLTFSSILCLFLIGSSLCISPSLRKRDDECKEYKNGMTFKQYTCIQEANDRIIQYRNYQKTWNKNWDIDSAPLIKAVHDNGKLQDEIERESSKLSAKLQKLDLDKLISGDLAEKEKNESNDKINESLSKLGDRRVYFAERANELAKNFTDEFNRRWDARMAESKRMQNYVFAKIDEAMSACTDAPSIGSVVSFIRGDASKKDIKPQSKLRYTTYSD